MNSARLPWADLGALGLLVLVTIGFFWRVLTSSSVYFPAGGGDLASFLYPMYSFIAASLRQGVLPLWNPYLYGGAPFAADIQTGLFYPIHLALFLLTGDVTYRMLEMLAIFHVWLAGAMMYFCLRGLLPGDAAIARLPAVVGSLAYMLSDFFVVHLGNLNMIEVAAWLPLAFLLLHRSLAQRSARHAVFAGFVLAIAYFAGHIQPFLYILLCIGLYALFHLSRVALQNRTSGPAEWRPSRWRALVQPAALSLLTLTVLIGLAAPLLLPSVEMAGYSARVDMSYTDAVQYSLAPAQLVGLLVPGLFGRDPGQFWGPWDRVEVGYLGVLPLFLAVLAIVLRREPIARFLALLVLLALFLALGGYSALYGWLHGLAPGFDKLRAPARFTLLLDFGLAALAALGLDALLRPLARAQRLFFRHSLKVLGLGFVVAAAAGTPLFYQALITSQDKDPAIFERAGRAANGWAIFVVLAGLSLAWLVASRWRWLSRGALAWSAVGLVAIDLLTLGANVDVGAQDPTTGFRHEAAVTWLKQDTGVYRVDTRTDVWDVWQPDLSLVYGIHDVSGIWNPLALADYEAYWGNLGSRSTPLYDFLNARYIIGHKNVKLDAKFTLAFDGDPQVNIYRNTSVLPRAQVVHQSQVVPRAGVLAALRDPGFHPASSVILETGAPQNVLNPGASSAVITAYDANALQVQVEAAAPGYLVLSEVWYPGWRAWVDGQETTVLRANYAFRAVAVPAGAHQVRMVFEPDTWRWGLLLAGGVLALGAGAAAWHAWRRRHGPPADTAGAGGRA